MTQLLDLLDLLDLLAHQAVEWDYLGQSRANCQLAGFSTLVESQMQGFDGSPILIRILPVQPDALNLPDLSLAPDVLERGDADTSALARALCVQWNTGLGR